VEEYEEGFADRLEDIIAEFSQVVSDMRRHHRLSFPEKVRRICSRLGGEKPGTGLAAHAIGVDPSTIIHWRKRPEDWHPSPEHERKVDGVYQKLFGDRQGE